VRPKEIITPDWSIEWMRHWALTQYHNPDATFNSKTVLDHFINDADEEWCESYLPKRFSQNTVVAGLDRLAKSGHVITVATRQRRLSRQVVELFAPLWEGPKRVITEESAAARRLYLINLSVEEALAEIMDKDAFDTVVDLINRIMKLPWSYQMMHLNTLAKKVGETPDRLAAMYAEYKEKINE
jgi:hypothetical protein